MVIEEGGKLLELRGPDRHETGRHSIPDLCPNTSSSLSISEAPPPELRVHYNLIQRLESLLEGQETESRRGYGEGEGLD